MIGIKPTAVTIILIINTFFNILPIYAQKSGGDMIPAKDSLMVTDYLVSAQKELIVETKEWKFVFSLFYNGGIYQMFYKLGINSIFLVVRILWLDYLIETCLLQWLQ